MPALLPRSPDRTETPPHTEPPRHTGGRGGWWLAVVVASVIGCADTSSDETATVTTDAAADALDGSTTGDVGGETGTERACNGHPELCDRRLDEVVFAATHNSMGAREMGFFAPNQEFGIVRQLEDGVRGFLIDTYRWRDDLYLCHADCGIGATLAVPEMRAMTAFLEAHPDEIALIIFQNGMSDDDSLRLYEESGLAELAIVPPVAGAPWPTLAELSDAGARVLITHEGGSPAVPWVTNAWDLFWDTAYTHASLDEMNCERNRGDVSHALSLVNHWIQAPISAPNNAAVANAAAALRDRVAECEATHGRLPTLLAVDFYDVGDVFEVVDELNGVASRRPDDASQR